MADKDTMRAFGTLGTVGLSFVISIVLGAGLALTCAALFAVRDNAVRFVARDANAPPLAASAASLLAASAVVLLIAAFLTFLTSRSQAPRAV